MNNDLLKIIVCPICKSKLHYNHINQELICNIDKLSFPIKKGIPILLKSSAHTIL